LGFTVFGFGVLPETRQFMVPLTFIVGKKYILWKSMGPETVCLLIFF